jgi:heat shock protein HslJ
MRSHKTSSTVFVAILTLGLVACGCAKSHEPTQQTMHPSATVSNPTSVTGTDWVLTRLGGTDGIPADLRARPWFRLDGSDKRRVTGNTGVNLINGTYELSGGALQFGPMITTKRAGDPALMQQEFNFLKALQKTATTDLKGRSLTLRDAGGAALAEFEAMDMSNK